MLQQLLTRQALFEKNKPSSHKRTESSNHEEGVCLTSPLTKWQLISREIKLHNWQTECLDTWLGLGRGTVKVATGGGKTILALAAAQELQNTKVPDLRLAIVVPTIPLMHQWLDELESANIPRELIALMGGGESIPNDPEIRILICVLNSARDRLPSVVNEFDWSAQLLLVVDECHRANATEAKKIFDANPKYTLGLSATPESETGDPNVPTNEAYAHSDVGKGLGPIIFEFSLKESQAAGLLTPFEVWHVGLPLNTDEGAEHAKLSREISELRKELQVAHRRRRSSQNFIAWCQTMASRKEGGDAARFIGMANERKRLIYRASARSQLTLDILSAAMQEEGRRVIVFHESIEDINNLFISAADREIPAVLEHSKLPSPLRTANIDAFRRGIARAIISAKSLVEGFNVPSADLGIIAASSGSVRQRIQSLGRMLRKKKTGGTAIVFVLYIKNTEDEAIYQKADWEAVIGAERNRYFEWTPRFDTNHATRNLKDLLNQFRKIDAPPRLYRPPCNEVDTGSLGIGVEYPGQTLGTELRVDQAGNMRADDRALARASKEIIHKVVETNRYRRAVLTPCGHLICRTGLKNGPEDVWIYLGQVDLLEEKQRGEKVKLTVKSASGCRVIARRNGRDEVYARGPEKASTREAGMTQKLLLEWVQEQEKRHSASIRELYWDKENTYWVEVNGERISFEGALATLEFPG